MRSDHVMRSCAFSHLPIPEDCPFVTVELIQTGWNGWRPCSVPSYSQEGLVSTSDWTRAKPADIYPAYIRRDVWDAWLALCTSLDDALSQVARFCEYMDPLGTGMFKSWLEGPGKDTCLASFLSSFQEQNANLFSDTRSLFFNDGYLLPVELVSGFVTLQALSSLLQRAHRVWLPSTPVTSIRVPGSSSSSVPPPDFLVHTEMNMAVLQIAHHAALKEAPVSEEALTEIATIPWSGSPVIAPDKNLRIRQRLRMCTVGSRGLQDPFESYFEEAARLITDENYEEATRLTNLLTQLCGPSDSDIVRLAWELLHDNPSP